MSRKQDEIDRFLNYFNDLKSEEAKTVVARYVSAKIKAFLPKRGAKARTRE